MEKHEHQDEGMPHTSCFSFSFFVCLFLFQTVNDLAGKCLSWVKRRGWEVRGRSGEERGYEGRGRMKCGRIRRRGEEKGKRVVIQCRGREGESTGGKDRQKIGRGEEGGRKPGEEEKAVERG